MAYRRFNITYYAMLISLFPLAVFIFSAINYKVSPVSSILDEIRTSLNDYPLSEFKYKSNCTNNEYTNAIYTFPGSVKGCTCVHVTDYYRDQTGEYQVNRGKCDDNQTYNGCEDISQIPPQKLYYWEKGNFCSKNYNQSQLIYNGYLYFLNSSVLENEECEKGYKKCGLLDDMGNYLCLPEEEECPINDIKITYNRNYELENQNYSYIFYNRRYIYYTNTSNNPVIIKLKATEGKICMDRSFYHSDFPQYILDNNFLNYGCRHKIDGKLYDDFEILDVRKKGDLYLDSFLQLYRPDYYGIWYYDFPFYSLEANMTLYPRRYIGYDKKCLIENGAFEIDNSFFNEKNILELDKKVSKIIHKNKFAFWFSICCFVLELLSCAAFNIDSEEQPIFIWLWTLVNMLFYVSMAVPVYLNVKNIQNFKEFPLCAGRIINIKIDFYNSTEKKLKINTILSAIFINLQIVFNIIIIILRYFYQYIDIPYQNKNYKNNSNIDYVKQTENENGETIPEQPYYNMNKQENTESGVDNLKPQSSYSNY